MSHSPRGVTTSGQNAHRCQQVVRVLDGKEKTTHSTAKKQRGKIRTGVGRIHQGDSRISVFTSHCWAKTS